MIRNLSIALMVFSALLAGISQCFLKYSAKKKHTSILNEFLNIQVIVGYSLLVITMFLNIIAYRNIEYKLGPIINSLTYVFVLFFGVVIFHEKLSKNKIFGIILILLGIFLFNL